MYRNKVEIVGNLTRDPEMKTLTNGVKVTNFSVATNRVWYDAQKQKQEEVEYHNVVSFGKIAESIAQYMVKGSQVMVDGRLKTQSWDDKDTQKKMYRTEIIAEQVQFGRRPDNAGTPQAQTGIEYPKATVDNPKFDEIEYPEEDINPDDIPF